MRSALTLLFLIAPALAQNVVLGETGRHGDIVTTKSGLTMPAGEFTIAEMIDAAAGYLCRNYIYDAAVVDQRAPFVLQRGIALDALGSEEVLYALLAARNLAALPLDELRGIYQVIALDPSSNASQPIATIPWRRPQDILRRPNFRELVLTAVTLEHLDAHQVANALRSHFAMQRAWQPGAPSASSAGQRTVLLHGYGDKIAQTIQVLREVDRAAAPLTRSKTVIPTEVLQRLDALEREVARLRSELKQQRR